MRLAFGSALFSAFLLLSNLSFASSSEENVVVSIGRDTIVKIKQQFRERVVVLKEFGDKALIRVSSSDLQNLSQFMHTAFDRCGGYVVESNNVQEAFENLADPTPIPFEHTEIRHQDLVKKAISKVDERNIRSTIEALSGFRNRLYTSQSGVHSQEWVGAKWQELTRNIPNTELQYFEHSEYPQRSVILTIKGTKRPDDIIVIGGHGDSISGWNPSENTLAPGADDNASGIATITEIIRIVGEMGLRPERTVKFMAYAAEEVGLRGSMDIAAAFKARNEHVVGVIQLDMTNYTKRPNEIVFMTDYTDAGQNAFMKQLSKTYIPEMTIQEDVCGYACSDHASWNRQGYPASTPFESRMNAHNPHIHTAKDTLAVSQNRADHAVPYSKLVLSYLIELGSVQ